MQLIGPFWKNHSQFFSQMCASMRGGHHCTLLKHCVIATQSQSFVLQQMKCGLLDSDNPTNGPWRKVVQPPLWACHSLTHSFTHCLTASLTHFSCFAAALLAKQQHCPLLVNDQLTWTATSHLKPYCHGYLTLALSHSFMSLHYEAFFPLVHKEKWRLLQFGKACLSFISDWATASQGLLVRRGHFTSAGESQWNSASGRDVAGCESPREG